MKHLSTAFLAAALSIPFFGSGQNVVVMMNDGTSHKFNADYVKEITFEDAGNIPALVFTSLTCTPYSGGSADLIFSTAGGAQYTISLVGPSNAHWLQTGTYTGDTSYSAYTFYTGWSYSNVKDGDVTQDIVGGTLDITQEEKVYTFQMSLELQDGSKVSGSYSGEVPNYSQWVDWTMCAASYNSNEREPGHFYVTMHDTDYNVEMALDIFADAAAKLLPAGEYVYSAENGVGTMSSKSYVDQYTPYSSNRLDEGSKMTVEVDGNIYTFSMDFIFDDGRFATIRYEGEISGNPVFTE